MQDTVQIAPATFTGQEPAATSDRTISYPLRHGGLLVAQCPDWCVLDHESDLDGRLEPTDLCHEGAPVTLEFATVEGTTARLLDARIAQYPFAGDGTERPYMALVPDANAGESSGWLSPGEFNSEIRRVEEHLAQLRALGVQLAEARADDHAQFTDHEWFRDGQGQPWLSIENDDIETMPVAYLLRVFGVTVVEVDADFRPADQLAVLSGPPGAMTLSFLRSVPQATRERLVRERLLESRGGRRG